MEYKLKKDRIVVCEIAFDSFTELPVESDLLLPDYCPDIVKVPKCQARPAFSKTEVSGDKCILEGATAITVYYTRRGWATANQRAQSGISKNA